MWMLQMNPMTGNTEDRHPIGWAETKEELEAFVNAERVDPYQEPGTSHFDGKPTTWRKTFRKGGPLEWMNPPEFAWEDNVYVNLGTREQWMEKSGQQFDNLQSMYRRLH